MRRLPRMTWSEAAAAKGRQYTPCVGDVVKTQAGTFGLWAGITPDGRHGWMIPLHPDTGLACSPRRALAAVYHDEIVARESLDDGETSRTVYCWLARADELYPGVHEDVVNQPMFAPSLKLPGDFLLDPNEPDKPIQLLALHRGHVLLQGVPELPASLSFAGYEVWHMLAAAPDEAPTFHVTVVEGSKLDGFLMAEHEPLDRDWERRASVWLHTPRRGSWVTSKVTNKQGVLINIIGPSTWEVQWQDTKIVETVIPDQVRVFGWSPC